MSLLREHGDPAYGITSEQVERTIERILRTIEDDYARCVSLLFRETLQRFRPDACWSLDYRRALSVEAPSEVVCEDAAAPVCNPVRDCMTALVASKVLESITARYSREPVNTDLYDQIRITSPEEPDEREETLAESIDREVLDHMNRVAEGLLVTPPPTPVVGVDRGSEPEGTAPDYARLAAILGLRESFRATTQRPTQYHPATMEIRAIPMRRLTPPSTTRHAIRHRVDVLSMYGTFFIDLPRNVDIGTVTVHIDDVFCNQWLPDYPEEWGPRVMLTRTVDVGETVLVQFHLLDGDDTPAWGPPPRDRTYDDQNSCMEVTLEAPRRRVALEEGFVYAPYIPVIRPPQENPQPEPSALCEGCNICSGCVEFTSREKTERPRPGFNWPWTRSPSAFPIITDLNP